MNKPTQSGMTLIELLISLALGLIIMGSLIQVIIRHSDTFSRTQALSRLQDQAGAALRMLRDDIELAGHWGLVSDARFIGGVPTATNDNPAALRVPSRCPARFTLDLLRNATATTDPNQWQCNITPLSGNDGLVLRFASAVEQSAQFNRLQLSTRLAEANVIDNGTKIAATIGPAELHDLHVMGYFVAPESTLFPGQPVLRRLTLQAMTNGPFYVDEEIAAGIEKFKIRMAIDADADNIADTWLPAGDPLLAQTATDGAARFPPLAVEVTLVIRSENRGWTKQAPDPFVLAGENWTPPNDGYLRLISTATFNLYNAGAMPS
ncbi:MAG: PilW family protein [Woeseiaceae bacterium]